MDISPGDATSAGHPVRVLVAESDGALRSVLAWVLDEDVRFRVVASAASADEVAACEAPFDVALVDLLLRGSTGLETVAGLCRRVPAPVVVVVAEVGPIYLRQAARAAGASGFLVRPGDLDGLADRLLELAGTVPTTSLQARIS